MNLCKSNDLTNDFIILTPNQRLARIARENHHEEILATPLKSWVITQWQSMVEKPKPLLNAHQTEILFRQIILNDDPTLSRLTALAVKSWKLLHERDVDLKHASFNKREETLLWQKWARSYQALLKKNHWIDEELVWYELLKPLKNLPKEIILLGFTDFTPRENKLFKHLETHGVKIKHENYSELPRQIIKTSFSDEEAEIEAIAVWAQQKAFQGRVACVFPDLSASKDKIWACFQRVFDDESLLNISLGKSLLDYGLIQSAFTGLELLKESIEIKSINQFLLSPYFYHSILNLSSRAMLDKKLSATLLPIIEKSQLPNIPFFQKTISSTTEKTIKEWLSVFQGQLKFLGWPGERTLSSQEYQLLLHWNTLLENLSHLSTLLGKIDVDAALSQLKKLAQKTIFQPESSPDTKVEILGILEAAGLTFDYVWVGGLHDDAWPLSSNPNPFLPFSLREENLKFCKNITHQLLVSGKEIILSYPKSKRDVPLYESPFIHSFPHTQFSVGEFIPPIHEIELERQHDNPVPLVLAADKFYGSEIFKDQAACAFRAFVKHRLGAKRIESSQWGFSALTKGNLIHKILENIDLAKPDIDTLLNTLINQNDLFSQAEKKRLENLILAWFELEKTREPYTVITREEKIETHLGTLPLRLRIDRIDKIGEDKYLIIDYKTGKSDIRIDPLEEPQLPLYCAISDLDIESVAIAYVRSSEMKLKKTDAHKEEWTKILHSLAEEFMSGHTSISPRHGEETCRYCDVSPLCKIKEIF